MKLIKKMKHFQWVRDIRDGLLDLIYPSDIYCISCNKPIEPGMPYSLCGDCIRLIPWANEYTCNCCGKLLTAWYGSETCTDCRRLAHSFVRGYTCAQYDGTIRELLLQFKYHEKGFLFLKLGEIMADRMALTDVNEDLIFPVPMYRRKEKKRGYNQAALLAAEVARYRGVTHRKDILLRREDTAPMHALTAIERRENMKQVFFIPPRKAALIKGKTVLLVDDIFTTGSTADACADTLLSGGADQVFVLTFAAGANIAIEKRDKSEKMG